MHLVEATLRTLVRMALRLRPSHIYSRLLVLHGPWPLRMWQRRGRTRGGTRYCSRTGRRSERRARHQSSLYRGRLGEYRTL